MPRVQVLDHGYIELVESWGSDERIIESARMSTNKGFLGWGPCPSCLKCGGPVTSKRDISFEETDYNCGKCGSVEVSDLGPLRDGDERLLRYLYTMRHSTPFEMAGMTIEIQAPIFVFREWHRHRTQSYSEMSARYTPLPDENYIPSVERLMLSSKTNKQAATIKESGDLTETGAEWFRKELMAQYATQESLYRCALQAGVPKELARIHLPVGRYSKMRASANLRNWLAFLTLRMDSAAQFEIRAYANQVGKIVAQKFPRTWALFIEGRSE